MCLCVCVHICVHVCRERDAGKCEDMGRKKTSYKGGSRMFKNVRVEGVCPREGATRSESRSVRAPGKKMREKARARGNQRVDKAQPRRWAPARP